MHVILYLSGYVSADDGGHAEGFSYCLQTMEGMLKGFQTDLSSISSEIQMLQEQSIAMNVRLKNRQSVRGELSQFVDEMVVSEAMIK